MHHQPAHSQPHPPPHSIRLMSGAEENRQYLRTFIQMYKDLPVLWDTSLRDYTNREKRAEAYQRLVPIYHYLKRDATVEDVKKKINTLRTNYRKELKVVESAIRSGSLHTPRCWTFQELDFLRNTEKFLAVNPTFKNEPQSFAFNESSTSTTAFLADQAGGHYAYRGVGGQTPNISEMFHKSFGHGQKIDGLGVTSAPAATMMHHQPPGHSGDYTLGKRSRLSPPPNAGTPSGGPNAGNDELLSMACEYLAGSYPEEESIARTWTHKLKRLPREQRLLAERFINEILFEAESNNLHRGSVQINNSFEPYVRFHEEPATTSTSGQEEQDKSQSPSVHTSTESSSTKPIVTVIGSGGSGGSGGGGGGGGVGGGGGASNGGNSF